MNFEQLRTYIEVVETGSFQKAAERNFMTQRAISISISKLETELGIQLVNRGKNKISITPAGRQFYVNIRDILHSLDITVDMLKSEQDGLDNTLNIGYSSPFEGGLLAQHINNFVQQNKHTQINTFEKSVENLVYDIILGTLDCAYIIDYKDSSPYLTNEHFTTYPIFTNQIVIGVSKLNPISQKAAINIEEIKKQPLLYCVPEESNYIKYGFLRALNLNSQLINVEREQSIEQMQIKVATNQALAHYCGGLIDLPLNDQIKYLPVEGIDTSYKIKLVYQRNCPKFPLIKHYLKSILKSHN